MNLEVFEGNLGEVFEVGGEVAGVRVGLDRAASLALMPKPKRSQKDGTVRRA